MKTRILELLTLSGNHFLSGEDMSRVCGISRAAVWKHIDHLKKEGYTIEAFTNKGYRLLENTEMMEPVFFKLPLNRVIGAQHIYLEKVDSTNSVAKAAAKDHPDGTVVISNCQTAGKGRLGRSWDSPENKGIWLSLILKPKVSMTDAMILTQMAGASVCDALLSAGYEAKIKWPNDIVIQGRKVCGILAELSGEPEQLNYVIVGIGINVIQESEDFAEELKGKAISLKMIKSIKVDRNLILELLLERLDYYYALVRKKDTHEITTFCRNNSATLEKQVQVIYNDKIIEGKAIDLTDNGALIIKDLTGQSIEIISGEVSVRGLYGYV